VAACFGCGNAWVVLCQVYGFMHPVTVHAFTLLELTTCVYVGHKGSTFVYPGVSGHDAATCGVGAETQACVAKPVERWLLVELLCCRRGSTKHSRQGFGGVLRVSGCCHSKV
jgi:hypothetical protein